MDSLSEDAGSADRADSDVEAGSEVEDAEADEEFRLVTEVMVVASQAPGRLREPELDAALGLPTGPGASPPERRVAR